VVVVAVFTFGGHGHVDIPLVEDEMIQLECLWTDFPGPLEFDFEARPPISEWCRQFKFVVGDI